jgi:hypothetical protein
MLRQPEISSNANAFVLGPNKPTASAAPVIAAAIKINTTSTPWLNNMPMIKVENTALKRLQL